MCPFESAHRLASSLFGTKKPKKSAKILRFINFSQDVASTVKEDPIRFLADGELCALIASRYGMRLYLKAVQDQLASIEPVDAIDHDFSSGPGFHLGQVLEAHTFETSMGPLLA